MPDLRNGSLEGKQCLEELQVPPSSCTSLKNSSLLCSLSLCCAGDRAGAQPAASLWRHGLAFQHGICWVYWGKVPSFAFLGEFFNK